MQCQTLDDYMTTYGSLLGQSAQRSLAPLHVPGRDEPLSLDFKRDLFEPQAHAAAAAIKCLDHSPAALLVAECGTGKTIMAHAIVHGHAAGKAYRAIVMFPPQLRGKWDEILATIPDAVVHQIHGFRDLTRLDRSIKPTQPEWWLVSETAAKDSSAWSVACTRRKHLDHPGVYRCPDCGRVVTDKAGTPLTRKQLESRKLFCTGDEDSPGCGSALWSYINSTGKWAPASYIHKHLPGYFDYFVADELHEEKSPDSARGIALGSISAACRKTIGLTGTLVGGYAWHLRAMLLRLAPTSLVADGFDWKNVTEFNRLYGRLETREKEREGGGDTNRNTRGRTTNTTKVQPGIMPTLFGKHLMDKCIFLSLEDLAADLPEFSEQVIPVAMDDELAAGYAECEEKLRAKMAEMLLEGDRRLLGAMLHCLMSYPDHPYGWEAVGYWDGEKPNQVYIPVVYPENLDDTVVRPKEEALMEAIVADHAAGRQVWVYTTMTGERDCAEMIRNLCEDNGLRAGLLRSSVPTTRREEWIAMNGPNLDVIVSHPQLVQTGLDLFDKGGKHNFCSLMFYSTGYNLFTLRQAARRAWRIGQRLPCSVKYFYYSGTMQERAMTLMGRKLSASEAIEGRFSSEGLAAMSGDDGSMEMALAKSLVHRLNDLDAARAWKKLSQAKPAGTKSSGKAARRRLDVVPGQVYLFGL